MKTVIIMNECNCGCKGCKPNNMCCEDHLGELDKYYPRAK